LKKQPEKRQKGETASISPSFFQIFDQNDLVKKSIPNKELAIWAIRNKIRAK
jgi:hypothetical protein